MNQNKLTNLITQKTGMSDDQAEKIVQNVLTFLHIEPPPAYVTYQQKPEPPTSWRHWQNNLEDTSSHYK